MKEELDISLLESGYYNLVAEGYILVVTGTYIQNAFSKFRVSKQNRARSTHRAKRFANTQQD
jgi:hypothetical protein